MIKKVLLISLVLLTFSYADKNIIKLLPSQDVFGQKISTYNAQLYLIDIWATWCPPCRMTIPELIELQDQYATKNVQVIGLFVNDSADNVQEYIREQKINYPVADGTKYLNNLPAVRGIPTIFLVDNAGKILKTYVGYAAKEVFKKEIDTQLTVKQPIK